MYCVQSGTGSGSLTTSIARSIAPTGHLYTFEFNPVRVEQAREDFKALRIDNLITVQHRDVCSTGECPDEDPCVACCAIFFSPSSCLDEDPYMV